MKSKENFTQQFAREMAQAVVEARTLWLAAGFCMGNVPACTTEGRKCRKRKNHKILFEETPHNSRLMV